MHNILQTTYNQPNVLENGKKIILPLFESFDKAFCDTKLTFQKIKREVQSNLRELVRIIFASDLLLGALTLHLDQYNGKKSEKYSEIN